MADVPIREARQWVLRTEVKPVGASGSINLLIQLVHRTCNEVVTTKLSRYEVSSLLDDMARHKCSPHAGL